MGFQVDHCDGPHLVLRHVRLYHHRQLLRWCVSHHALVQCNISMHGTRTFRGVLVAGMCVCMLAAFVRGVALEPGPRVLPAPLTHATPLSTHTHTHTHRRCNGYDGNVPVRVWIRSLQDQAGYNQKCNTPPVDVDHATR